MMLTLRDFLELLALVVFLVATFIGAPLLGLWISG